MTGPTTLLLTGADVLTALTPAEVVGSQETAFRLVARPEEYRAGSFHYTAAGESLAFAHGAWASGGAGVVFKTGVQCTGNAQRGLPTVHGTVSVHDPDTGVVLGLLNGAAVTALRTAGGVAAALRTLMSGAPPRIGVFGSGVQARELVRLLVAVLPVEQCLVWSPRLHGCGDLSGDPAWAGLPVRVAPSPEELCRSSTVIATCTTSAEPVLSGDWLQPGTTVATMGSYLPDRCEIDVAASRRADVTVLDSASAATGIGPMVAAAAAGASNAVAPVLLGDVLREHAYGRTDEDQVVVFHSSGLGLQDATLAWAVYTRALARGHGVQVHL